MRTGVLRSLRRRLAGWVALRTGALLVGAVGLLALAAVLLDAAFDLPESARVAAPWALAGCAALVLSLGAWQWRRLEEGRVARLFERAEPSLGNRLINAVQLARRTGARGVEEYLRREAVALGRLTASQVLVWPAVRRGVCWAAAGVGVAAVAWLGFVTAAVDVLAAVAPRFLDARGDHPPYSKLRIEVSPGTAQVLYGGQVEIRARTSGRPADKLWLVARSGANVTRAIMFLAPDKSFFQTLSNLREPAKYHVTDGQARSRRFAISLRYTPQITLVEVSTIWPEYTGRPPHTGKLSEEPQALPEDTRVTFRVASNRPLKSGRLSLTPVLGGQPSIVLLKPEPQDHFVSGSFTLTQAVVFSLSVRDVKDLDSADPKQGRFNILPDERPRIFVLEPGRDAVATPTIRVPVRVEAQDDYCVTRVMWLRGLNRSVERPFNMKLMLKGGPQLVEAAGAFDFAQLGVRPGDVIDYYFEAADNYPRGPNLAFSKPYRIQIISPEQYAAILRQAAARKALFEPYFQLDAWLRRLAERARSLEQPAASGSDAEKQAAAKNAAALADELAKYEGELGQLLQQAIMFDVEESFRKTLVEQHTRVGQARAKLKEALGGGQLALKPLSEASDLLSRLAQTEDEEVDQPARRIAAVAHLLARADSFVKLAQQQAALAQMVRRFADRTGGLSPVEQMELQELAYQQRRVQEGLRALLGSLPDLLAQVPDEPDYAPLRQDINAFLQAVADGRIEEDLADSTRTIALLDGKSGYTFAQRAAENMDKLIAKCCAGLPQQGRQCLRFKPSVTLGNTLDQILAALGAAGANNGNGQNGRDGYGLFNDDLALYGPNAELAGEQAGGRRESAPAAAGRAQRVPGDGRDPALRRAEAPGRVRLQPDAKFPLRYRDLVGEYFRVIAESENEGK